MGLKDDRMMQRAMRERWPIKPEYREAFVRRMVRIIADPKSKNREAISAGRALVSADSQNVPMQISVSVEPGSQRQQADDVLNDLNPAELMVLRSAHQKLLAKGVDPVAVASPTDAQTVDAVEVVDVTPE